MSTVTVWMKNSVISHSRQTVKDGCCIKVLYVISIYCGNVPCPAFPGHGGVPGGRGRQWEAAAGGDSPGSGGGHAEWPAPSGLGELPGRSTSWSPQGKCHTLVYWTTALTVSPSLIHLVLLSSHVSVWPHTRPQANPISCKETHCQVVLHHERNGLLINTSSNPTWAQSQSHLNSLS